MWLRGVARAVFPIVRGVPILIDETKSLLRVADYAREPARVLDASTRGTSPLRRFVRGVYDRLPDANVTLASRENYERFAKLLHERGPSLHVLVVGGREAGRGMQVVLEDGRIELVETDIDFGPRTQLVCDAHQLPFAAGQFDGVVIQAVLEHVLDPHRCVEEIHRVLAPQGLVFAETPFLYRRTPARSISPASHSWVTGVSSGASTKSPPEWASVPAWRWRCRTRGFCCA